jgi:DNA-binding transcriptional ArsR family regulator
MDVESAIADPVRREIMMLLRDGMRSAGEIAGCFEVSRPAISRHLRVLRQAGLVVATLRGRNRLYRLDLAPLAPLESWLAALHDPWAGPLDALETEVYRTRRERREKPSQRQEKSA